MLNWVVSESPSATSLRPWAIEPATRVKIAVDHIREIVEGERASGAEAEALLRDELRYAPADGRIYSALGALADVAGRKDEAQALYRTALRLSPAEQAANLEVAARDAAAGDFVSAVDHLDVLLTRWPAQVQNARPVMLAVIADAAGRARLVATLSKPPPWRLDFVRSLAFDKTTADRAGVVLQALLAAGQQPTPEETRATIGGLMNARQPLAAYQLFLATLSAEERPLASFVFDGAFTRAPKGRPFEWRAERYPGVEVSFAGAGAGARLTFRDLPVTFFDFQQTLALAPGRYKIAVEASGERLVAPRPFSFVVRCAPPGPALTSAALPVGDFRRTVVEREFETPAQGCDSQEIALVSGLTADSWALRQSGVLVLHAVAIELADR